MEIKLLFNSLSNTKFIDEEEEDFYAYEIYLPIEWPFDFLPRKGEFIRMMDLLKHHRCTNDKYNEFQTVCWMVKDVYYEDINKIMFPVLLLESSSH